MRVMSSILLCELCQVFSYVKYLMNVTLLRYVTVLLCYGHDKARTLPSFRRESEAILSILVLSLNLSSATRLPVSVSEGFSSSGLMWRYFMLRLRKQMACSPST